MTTTGTLLITRPRQFADIFRRYRVFVDDNEVGRIKRGGVLQVQVPDGDHAVVARIDWARSNFLNVTVRAGDTTELEVGSNVRERARLGTVYSVTVGAESYLYLRPRVVGFPVVPGGQAGR